MITTIILLSLNMLLFLGIAFYSGYIWGKIKAAREIRRNVDEMLLKPLKEFEQEIRQKNKIMNGMIDNNELRIPGGPTLRPYNTSQEMKN